MRLVTEGFEGFEGVLCSHARFSRESVTSHHRHEDRWSCPPSLPDGEAFRGTSEVKDFDVVGSFTVRILPLQVQLLQALSFGHWRLQALPRVVTFNALAKRL